jgi:hypothetical protein
MEISKVMTHEQLRRFDLAVLQKPQTTKYDHQQQNKSNTLKNHNIPSLTQFRSCNM